MNRKLTIDNRIRRRGGFTLTEVVVASTLLILAIVPILKGLTSVHLNSSRIERKTRSLSLAQAKLDEIKARSVYNYTDNFTEANESLDGPYLCTVKDGAISANLRVMAVAVGYDVDGDSVLSSDESLVTLQTMIARRW